MKCLLILPRPVFPLVCGYAHKNYHLIKILSAHYELHLVIITSDELTKEEDEFYKSLGVLVHVYRLSKFKRYARALLSIFSKKPLQVNYYYDKQLQKELYPFINDCTILISALVRTREYLNVPALTSDKIVVFDMVDSIALNYLHSKNSTKSLFWRAIYTIEGKQLLKYEREMIQKSAITYLFNKQEQTYWKKYGNVQVLPHGVKEELFVYNKKDWRLEHSVVFIGKMNYQPNIDAVLWYLENVHARIGQQVPLIITGAYPVEKIYTCAQKLPNVTITGFVDDPYIYLNSAKALIAPMQSGGGIQNKVLEGMALGKVNIISSLAAKPITGGRDHVHFLIADCPEDYIKILLNWDENLEKYQQIEKNAQELVHSTYSWAQYGAQYIQGINVCLQERNRLR